MRFHIHHDPNWQLVGCNRYYICKRCGALRTARAYRSPWGPIEPGWPALTDRHGQEQNLSAWVKSTGISTYPKRG